MLQCWVLYSGNISAFSAKPEHLLTHVKMSQIKALKKNGTPFLVVDQT